MVKVAVTGIGFMGKMHLGIYNELENVEIAALCDIEQEAMNITTLDAGGNIEGTGGEIDLSSAGTYTDFNKMLEAGGFDVVDICLPTYMHRNYSVRALEAGYHVFCEKPLAMDGKETDAIADAVKKSGKLFSVGQCLRFWPAYTELKKIIDLGKYGKVTYAEFARYSSTPTWAWDGWLLDSKRSGSAALDLHIHDSDTILWLFGVPKSVRSIGVPSGDGSFSHLTTVYNYDDVAVTSTSGWSCSSSYGFNMRCFVILEQAVIEMDFSKPDVLTVAPEGGEKHAVPLPEKDGYFYELEEFVEGIEKGSLSDKVTVDTAAASVKLCRAEIESARKNKEVPVRI